MDRQVEDPHGVGMHLPVFYCPEMIATPRSYSPSAEKPRQVVASWQALGLSIDVRAPEPVSVTDLVRAHDAGYVEGVLACRIENGFGDRSPEVAASLRWTSGAMLSAAREALRTRSFACAPCSGFHHAGFAHGGGFCTFNGLVVAARALVAVDGVGAVGILDCDMHYGDGTDEILRRSASESIVHFTAGATYRRPRQAEEFLARLPEIVRSMSRCDVILYQAGADPHVRDPLGGWLDDAQLRRRDEIVFETARSCGVPVAWNLAGGYQRDARGGIAPVLSIHAETARACLAAS